MQLLSMNISPSTQDDRRHTEEKLAGMMIWIVIIFLVCHFPRIVASFHAAASVIGLMSGVACENIGYSSIPLWVLELNEITNILLVLKSSLNCIIYFMSCSKYRAQAKDILLSIKILPGV